MTQQPAPAPNHYAPFAGFFGIALTALPVIARRRHSRRRWPHRSGAPTQLSPFDLAELSLATFAATHILVKEKVAEFIREPFVEETPDNGRQPRAPDPAANKPGPDVEDLPAELRLMLGELLTCTRCAGAWNAAGLTYLRLLAPDHGRVVLHVLAAVGANHFLQAGFAALKSACRVLDAQLEAPAANDDERSRERWSSRPTRSADSAVTRS